MSGSPKVERRWTEDGMDEWLKELPRVCTHCGSNSGHKFLQMANGKTSQPRYRCTSCGNTFTHNGKVRTTKARASHTVHGVSPALMKNPTVQRAKSRDAVYRALNEVMDWEAPEPVRIADDKVVYLVRVGASSGDRFRFHVKHGWKILTDEEKMVADESGEDYCCAEAYFDPRGVEGDVEMLISVENRDDDEVGEGASTSTVVIC